MGNPLAEGFQTYAALRNMDIQDQQLEMQKQSHVDQQAALRFSQDRQVKEDVRLQASHDAALATNQRKIEGDVTRSVGYAVQGALDSGQNEIDYNAWTPAQQKWAEDNGRVNTRIKTNGSQAKTINISNFGVNDAQQISPIFSGKSPEEVSAITQGLGVVRSHLDRITGDMQANPQKYASGIRITREQSPELFGALNIAIAPQVNKGLDDRIAKKEVSGAVVNPDGSVSVEVESFGKDGRSMGRAPVTYGRGNGDPASIVMTIPAASLYKYIEVNEQLGQQIKARQIELGDDEPIKEQQSRGEIRKAMKAIESIPEGERSEKRNIMYAGLKAGLKFPESNSLAALRPDKVYRDPKVEWMGVPGKPALEQAYRDGVAVPEDKGGVRQRFAPHAPKEPKTDIERRTAIRQDRQTIKDASRRIDAERAVLAKLKAAAPDMDHEEQQAIIDAAINDYQTLTAEYKTDWSEEYDPSGHKVAAIKGVAETAQANSKTTARIKPLVEAFKETGGFRSDPAGLIASARSKRWAESDIALAVKGTPAEKYYTSPATNAMTQPTIKKPAPAKTKGVDPSAGYSFVNGKIVPNK